VPGARVVEAVLLSPFILPVLIIGSRCCSSWR